MNLKEKLNRELTRLEGLGPFGGSRRIQFAEGQGQLSCDLGSLDQIGCQLIELRFATDRLENATIEDLQDLGQNLATRLSYLMEAICPVEIDAESCAVQLRSNPPQRKEDGTYYFELMVRKGGDVALSRYHKSVGQPRVKAFADMTREALLRLAHDVANWD